MAQTYGNLGDILVEEGILSRDELQEVLEKSRTRNLSLEETLFKLGYISRDRMGIFLARLHGCEFIDLNSRRIDDEALRAIDSRVALKLGALPFAQEAEALSVALAGPFQEGQLEEAVKELERASGKKVRVALCNSETLKETLQKFYKEKAESVAPAQDELSSIIESIKTEDADRSLRAQFEELHDLGQTALIGARSHPFSRAVASAIEKARTSLADSKKYAESGFEEEAVEMARQAVSLLKEATAKADSVESDWEKLVQQVKNLRARIGALEEDRATEYAPSEFKELAEIRNALLECVNERNVDGLRSLLDQGTIIIEKVSLLSPHRNRGREQVIASLAQVRSVIARARKAGAKDHAPDVLKEAYGFLDKAEAYARNAQWDEVRECLTSAEARALEAEHIAARAAREKEELKVKLRQAIRAATAALEKAMTHPFSQEVIEDLMRAKDVINEAKACFDSRELERGIGLAERAGREIREEIIVNADQAEQAWSELFQRADKVSAQIQSTDMSLALKAACDKMELLFRSEREMIGCLCERNRESLADAVSICENLVREIHDSIGPVKDRLQEAKSAIARASGLLTSAAALSIDEGVASAYEEARRLLEDARDFAEGGNADGACDSAEAAQVKLEEEVISRQRASRDKWLELIPLATEVIRRVDEAFSQDAVYYCPDLVHILRVHASEMFSAVMARDPERVEACISPIEEILQSIGAAVNTGREKQHSSISEQLAEIEQAVQTAVQRCSGNYAPDMLENTYLDINRIKEQISGAPEALDAALANNLLRDLAVAKTRVWQVEFLRERFEREREENLNQLRLKMDSAREEIEDCASLDFASETSPLMQKARALFERADSLLIEGDIEESFELVRQTHAATEQVRVEAGENERRWRELSESLIAEESPHQKILSDPTAPKMAGEEHKRLVALVEQTQSIVDTRDLEALEGHAGRLRRLSDEITEKMQGFKEETRAGTEKEIRDAEQEIRLAQLLKADDFCPDLINAARAYLSVARSYMTSNDFEQVASAARDALAKARDASDLAKAGSERASLLALDYMKIALAKMEQQDLDAAQQSLEKGLSLAARAVSGAQEQEPA